MARAIQDELASRSVTVIRIERGENDSIGSRSIICQLLHKPEAAFQPDDVETLFETLLDREDHAQRHAIIVEDAELLRPDALQYLRLVSSMVPKQMPPVVFVGRLSAWDEPGQPAGADARDLVTWRVELEPLSDDEAQAFIRQRLPATSARGRLDDAARDALVRSADGCIGRLAALLTAAADMLGPGDTAGAACTVTHPADGQDPTLTLDEPVPVAEHGAALTILPMSDIVLHPVAGPPLVEHLRNTPRWHAAVRHLTAAVLPLTVVGAIAYWQLTVHAGQLQGATNSAPTPTALSGVGNLSLAASSNAAIDDNVATERPVEALPSAADLLPGPSGPLPASIPAALPAPVFRTVSSDEADERPAPMAGLSVVPSDDRDAVWLVLDSAGADQLPGLASAPAEPPPQSPPIAQSAAGTEPAAPQVRTAAVPDEPSPDEPSKVPTATNTAAPLPTTEKRHPPHLFPRTAGQAAKPVPTMPRIQAVTSGTLTPSRSMPPNRPTPAHRGPSVCRRRQPTPSHCRPRFQPFHSRSPILRRRRQCWLRRQSVRLSPHPHPPPCPPAPNRKHRVPPSSCRPRQCRRSNRRPARCPRSRCPTKCRRRRRRSRWPRQRLSRRRPRPRRPSALLLRRQAVRSWPHPCPPAPNRKHRELRCRRAARASAAATIGHWPVTPGRRARRRAGDVAEGPVGRSSACRAAIRLDGGSREFGSLAAGSGAAEAAPCGGTGRVRPASGSRIAPVTWRRDVGAWRHICRTPVLRASGCTRQRRSGDFPWQHL